MSRSNLVVLSSRIGIPLQYGDYEASDMLRAYFWWETCRYRFDTAKDEWASFFVRTRQTFEEEALEAQEVLRQWARNTSNNAIALVYGSTQHDETIEDEQFFQSILPNLVEEERVQQIENAYKEMLVVVGFGKPA